MEKPLKKTVHYYPFGLKHKGYNYVTTSNGNSTAQKFKYNGVEYEEVLGLNLYEMDVRMYDPSIARWNAIDPVTHWSLSTYNGFDNNPIYWADPSGADSWKYISNGIYRNNQTGEETTDYRRAIDETKAHVDSGGCTDPPCKKPAKGQSGETIGSFFKGLMGALAGHLNLLTPDYKGKGLTEAQAALIEKRKKEKQEVQMAIAEQTLEITQSSLEYGSMIIPTGPGQFAALTGLARKFFIKTMTKESKVIVIGEGMNLVKSAAKNLQSKGINAKWYQAWGKNFPINSPEAMSAALRRNERWIRTKIKKGYTIYDNGPVGNGSPFYKLEKKVIKEFSYPTIPIRFR